MAVAQRHLDRGGHQILSVASNDPSATGDAADFKVKIGETLQFSGGQDEWVVTLRDCFFRHPGSSTSVYISTNLSVPRIDGSELTDVIVRVPPTSTAGPYYFLEISTLPLWMPLQKMDVREIELSLTDDAGNAIPIVAGDTTTATFLIKRATSL